MSWSCVDLNKATKGGGGIRVDASLASFHGNASMGANWATGGASAATLSNGGVLELLDSAVIRDAAVDYYSSAPSEQRKLFVSMQRNTRVELRGHASMRGGTGSIVECITAIWQTHSTSTVSFSRLEATASIIQLWGHTAVWSSKGSDYSEADQSGGHAVALVLSQGASLDWTLPLDTLRHHQEQFMCLKSYSMFYCRIQRVCHYPQTWTSPAGFVCPLRGHGSSVTRVN